METSRPKTIICDIDGVLLQHLGNLTTQLVYAPKLIEGTVEKINEWDKKGYNIILLTGRRESMRERTEKDLASVGIFYDQLIMGVGGGDRIIINDRKPKSERDTCYAFNLKRNDGIKNLDI